MKKFRFKKKKESPFPRVSHTKGYYRFSKDFPSVTDSEGFRDNNVIINSHAKKASVRRRLALLFVCVFVIAFTVTSLCHAVSDLPIETQTEQSTEETAQTMTLSGGKMAKLTRDVLSYSSVESFMGSFRAENISAVIIEFKDAQGYFYYKPSISTSSEAISKASDNAAKIINDFKSAGIEVYASVSCFADDIYARNHQDQAAYIVTTPESGSYEEVHSIWYGGEKSTNAWLSPFSNEVLYYLNTVMSDINALGVTGIIFENAVLPFEAESENVQFSLSDGYETSAREKMAQWVAYANSAVNCKTGLAVSSAQMVSFAKDTAIDICFSSGCDFTVLDARATAAQKGVSINSKQYLDPEKTPAEYTSALLAMAADFLSANEIDGQIIPIIDDNDTADAVISALAALNNTKIQSCILE